MITPDVNLNIKEFPLGKISDSYAALPSLQTYSGIQLRVCHSKEAP